MGTWPRRAFGRFLGSASISCPHQRSVLIWTRAQCAVLPQTSPNARCAKALALVPKAQPSYQDCAISCNAPMTPKTEPTRATTTIMAFHASSNLERGFFAAWESLT